MEKNTEEIYKDRESLIERYRLSSRPKLYKLDNQGVIELWNLTERLIREHKKEFAQRLRKLGLLNVIDNLTPREQKILEMRFLEFKILEEVSKEFGVTRERIKQIEIKALEKIKSRTQK